MKQRICLIIPPSPFLADERVFPSLGILKVAACLEKAGYPVEVLDLCGVANYEEVARQHFSSTEYYLAGITMTTPQLPSAEKVSRIIREVSPETTICYGGPHITSAFAAFKREMKLGINRRAHTAMQHLNEEADILVAGDGEEAILQALQEYPPSVIDADNPNSALFLTPASFSTYPFPARHLIDIHSYHYEIDGANSTALISQLGCCFPCQFCGGRLSPSFRRVRLRSTDHLLAEIREIYEKYGFRGLNFFDDELNVNKNLVADLRAFIRMQEKMQVEFRCRGFVKAELFTEDQAKALYDAGFRKLLIGFESGDPRILINIQKKASVDDNTRCMEIAYKQGLQVKALMSVGHAGESEESIMATYDWLLKVQPDDFDCAVITCYPSTPYYDFAEPHPDQRDVWVYTAKNGDRLYSWELNFAREEVYYKGVPGDYRSFVWTDYISAERIVEMRNWLESAVRTKLNIPFCQVTPAVRYDASMGQLPGHILRKSEKDR